MTINLKVSKPSPPAWYHEFNFDQDTVTIGRSSRAELQLEGINSVVSREHARILRKGESCVLVDLNSMNKTALNGTELKAEQEYDLRPGDKIRICDYEIEFALVAKAAAPSPPPEPAPAPRDNPFLADLAELAKVLDRLALLYEIDESPRKNQDLNEALHKALKDQKGRKAGEILGGFLGGGRTIQTVAIPGREGAEVDILSNYERVQNLINALFEFLTKLIQARVKFRQEFLNETIIKSKAFSFDGCTPDELKAYLFDVGPSPDEGQKRTEALSIVLEELLLHQLSLLEGYKTAVNEGAKRFLDRTNPARLKELLAERKLRIGPLSLPAGSLPILRLAKLLEVQAEVYKELSAEDQSVIEERYFRPSYKRSYYNCSRASRRKPPKPEKPAES